MKIMISKATEVHKALGLHTYGPSFSCDGKPYRVCPECFHIQMATRVRINEWIDSQYNSLSVRKEHRRGWIVLRKKIIKAMNLPSGTVL